MTGDGSPSSLQAAMDEYLAMVRRSRSDRTHATYATGLRRFSQALRDAGFPPETTLVEDLAPAWIEGLMEATADQAVATERTYLAPTVAFYRFVAGRRWAALNLAELDLYLDQRRRQGRRIPPFHKQAIEKILAAARRDLAEPGVPPDPDAPGYAFARYLVGLRDPAILLTLAATGLRVSELCGLQRRDIRWDEARAAIIGKGDKEGIVRFTDESLRAIRRYLRARRPLDEAQGVPLTGLPVFASHSRRSGRRLVALSPRSVQEMVANWVAREVGPESVGTITPHTFRHYFVSVAVQATGGNLPVVKELARHESVATTSRYTHVADDDVEAAYRAAGQAMTGASQ